MEQILKNLMLFNNTIASKAEWNIIFRGCGCPKNTYFWKSMRDNDLLHLLRNGFYTLRNVDPETFQNVWNEYCVNNRASVKRVYDKKKRLKKIEEYRNNAKPRKFISIGGCICVDEEYDFD